MKEFLIKYKWLIKASGIARKIGMSPDLFFQKLHCRDYNKFSSEEIESIKQVIDQSIKDYSSLKINNCRTY